VNLFVNTKEYVDVNEFFHVHLFADVVTSRFFVSVAIGCYGNWW